MNRKNQILSLLLGAQIVLAAILLTRSDANPGLTQARAIVPALNVDAVEHVVIYMPRTSGADESVALEFRKTADTWNIVNKFNYPADSAAVTRLVSALGAMTSRGPATTSKDGLAQLGLADDEYEGKIKLGLPSGERIVYVGKETGFRQRPVRLSGSSDSFTVSGLGDDVLSVSLSDWIDPVYFEIGKADITSLSIERGGQVLALTKSAADTADTADTAASAAPGGWQLAASGEPSEPAPVDDKKLDPLLAAVNRIELNDVISADDAACAFSAPQARVTIVGKSAAPDTPADTFVIELGAAKGSNTCVRLTGNAHAVLVASSKLAPLIDTTRASLLPEPPATKAAAGAATKGSKKGSK